MKIALVLGIIFLAIGAWFLLGKTSAPESGIISRNGLHWHAELNINILGEALDVPAGIGLEKLPHKPLHTHDRDNVIHLEFAGTVRKDDIKLGKFFEVWGKTFNKNCIFDECSGSNGQLKMLVNGEDNVDFENYIMQDGDKIAIIFEKAIASPIKELTIAASEYGFNPSSITVSAGERVKITFRNDGNMSHNLVVEDLNIGTKIIGPGQTDIIEFTATDAGTYAFICSVPGHAIAGMRGSLIVK